MRRLVLRNHWIEKSFLVTMSDRPGGRGQLLVPDRAPEEGQPSSRRRRESIVL